MPTRNVVLTEQQHEFVEAMVRSGRYQNASEVLREGLRLIEDREREDAARLQALRAAAEQGWADVAAGRYTDLADDELDDFIGGLGARATSRTTPSVQ
jgi:antitoxin ParD1/3/4